LARLDFSCVRGRNGRELVRRNEPALEEVHLAVEFELLRDEPVVADADGGAHVVWEESLVSEVVNREHDRRRARARRSLELTQVHGYERRGPIVRVNDVEGSTRLRALPHELGGRAREDGEATRVVRIIGASLAVHPFAIIETGRVEQEQLDAGAQPAVVDGDFDLLRAHRERERREPSRDEKPSALERGEARQCQRDLVAELPKRFAQRCDDVGEPADFGERRKLRRSE
jgi:hypothetical protein